MLVASYLWQRIKVRIL